MGGQRDLFWDRFLRRRIDCETGLLAKRDFTPSSVNRYLLFYHEKKLFFAMKEGIL